MARFTLPSPVVHSLDRRLDEFQKREIQLADLPLPVSAWYHAGWADGRAELQAEVDRLHNLIDIYWAEAYLSKDDRRERILRRLDAGLATATAEQWDRLEADLHRMAGDDQSPRQNAGGHELLQLHNDDQVSPFGAAQTAAGKESKWRHEDKKNFGRQEGNSLRSDNGRERAA